MDVIREGEEEKGGVSCLGGVNSSSGISCLREVSRFGKRGEGYRGRREKGSGGQRDQESQRD